MTKLLDYLIIIAIVYYFTFPDTLYLSVLFFTQTHHLWYCHIIFRSVPFNIYFCLATYHTLILFSFCFRCVCLLLQFFETGSDICGLFNYRIRVARDASMISSWHRLTHCVLFVNLTLMLSCFAFISQCYCIMR